MKYNEDIIAHDRNIRYELFKALLAARDSIQISMCYFSDRVLLKLLCIKAFAGIEVVIIVDRNAVNKRFSNSLRDAADLGCQIFWHHSSHLMHNKFLIIDSSTLITGSYNMTNAATNNLENIVVIHSNEALNNRYINSMQKLKLNSRRVEPRFRVKATNSFLTPLMECRLGMSVGYGTSVAIEASENNKKLLLDYTWHPFKLSSFGIRDIIRNDGSGKRMELLFRKFPEMAFFLSYISFAIGVTCPECEKSIICSWFHLHEQPQCICQEKVSNIFGFN